MNITHPELAKALLKPGQAIVDSLTPTKADALHNAVGVSGEAGELSRAVMQAIEIGRNDETIDTLDRVNIVEELGDLCFYFEGLCQNYGIENYGFDYSTSDGIGHDQHLKLAMACLQLEACAATVLDIVKKEVIYEKPRDRLRVEVVLEELQGAVCKFGRICNSYGYSCLGNDITHDEVLTGNIAKLSVRYDKLTYSNDAAQARADKPEESEQSLADLHDKHY